MKNIVYMFWTNVDTKLPKNRLKYFEQFKKKIGANVILVTNDNLDNFILKNHPLHSGFKYLSEMHKADYLRCYFMNFYGGGYSDIKYTSGSWIPSFNKLKNSDKLVIGYKEFGPNEVSGDKYLKEKWEDLIGNGCYICKPQTKFTKEWYSKLLEILVNKFEILKKNPASYSKDHFEDKNTNYPIGWNEILGRIFHQLCFKYRDLIFNTLPSCICVINEKELNINNLQEVKKIFEILLKRNIFTLEEKKNIYKVYLKFFYFLKDEINIIKELN